MKTPDGITICYSRDLMCELFDELETMPQEVFNFLNVLQMSCKALEETPEERAERVENFLKYLESRTPDDERQTEYKARLNRLTAYLLEELDQEDQEDA